MASSFGGRRLGVLFALLLAVALLVLAGQVAGAQQAPAANSSETAVPVPAEVGPAAPVVGGGPGHVMVHNSAFRPRYSSTEYSGGTTLSTQSGSGLYDAPVYLPHGATINQLTLYYYDYDPTSNITAVLTQSQVPLSGTYTVASVATSGQMDGHTAIATTDINLYRARVDLEAYTYFVNLNLPPSLNLRVVAVRIDYTFDSYLPLTVKP